MERDPFNHDANKHQHPTAQNILKSYHTPTEKVADQLQKGEGAGIDDVKQPTQQPVEETAIQAHRRQIADNITKSYNPIALEKGEESKQDETEV